MESTIDDSVVAAARSGDPAARAQLAADCLPLAYNVVGRALSGHADVDDVVQETMLRMLNKVTDLRDISSFRSWFIAIALNQVRTHCTARAKAADRLSDDVDQADPADFAGLTVLRLQLSGDRREVVEATRWLDESEREVLSLWWLETAGTMSRAELAAGLGLSPQHAAVRVQRVKNQLETSRAVVRALAADPPCGQLASVTALWDGRPTPLWRKRVAAHTRRCPVCDVRARALVPVDGLLASIGLVVPLYAGTALFQTIKEAAGQVPVRNVSSAIPYSGAAVSVAAAAILVLVWPSSERPDNPRGSAPPPSASPRVGSPSVPAASPAITLEPDIAPTASPSTRPSTNHDRTEKPLTPQERMVERVNELRGDHGCRELLPHPQLARVAQRHSEDMRAHAYVNHIDSSGTETGERVRAVGYVWSAVGETLVHGPRDPRAAVEQWMTEMGNDPDFMNCDYRHVGVGIVDSPSGPYWTQLLATPR